LVPDITLFGSPWSPPAWMKTNNDILHGGKLKPECMNSWANYYVKFIQEYKKQGINIWGLTVQNEPMATQTWESCIFSAQDECNFIKKYLGPVLQKNNMPDIKLMIWDHNRGIMFQRAQVVYDDPEASKYVWGMGYHWYAGDHFENARMVHDAFPSKHLLVTEACNYPYDSASMYDWKLAESYGRSIICDLNNWAEGWTDWNILLDEKGGPNHVGNYCYAHIHGDTRTGKILFLNSYYYMGHFSKFIRPGAKRIACTSNSDELKATAFTNSDGSIVVVVMNESEKNIDFSICVNKKAAKTISPAHSIVTVKI
jgi:glucosylceramidase